MTDIRVLAGADQYRAHLTLFLRALHYPAPNDERWEANIPSYEDGRVFAAFEGDEMVGTTASYGSAMVVPGGAVVPHAAVSRVGVRADHRRRGVLTALMKEQLSALDEPAVTLRATEGRIYGRYGYGVAGRVRNVKLDKWKAVIPGEMSGRVRMIDLDTGDKLLPGLHEAIGLTRPGQIRRWPGWWARERARSLGTDNVVTVVHSGPDGDDGFLSYQVSEFDGHKHKMAIYDFVHANADAWRDLWIYALGVDLVDTIEREGAPLDEPLEWLLEDSRAMSSPEMWDEIWLRLTDVPRMLAARTYGVAEPVVLEVHDALLPANSGRYRISPDGAERVDAPADFALPVDLLGAVYLGGSTFTQLVASKRIEGTRVADADALFAVPEKPYCGTFF